MYGVRNFMKNVNFLWIECGKFEFGFVESFGVLGDALFGNGGF
jgi:hypothetical protein